MKFSKIIIAFSAAVSITLAAAHGLANSQEKEFYYSEGYFLSEARTTGAHTVFTHILSGCEPFESAVEYKTNLSAASVTQFRSDNFFKIKLDNSNMVYDDDDAVYLSFYYKSKSKVVIENSEYDAADSCPVWISNDGGVTTNKANYLISMQTGTLSENVGLISDDEWHKMELYQPKQYFNDTIIVSIPYISLRADIMFADFSLGILHFPDGVSYNNDMAYTDLGDFLVSSADAVIVNGKTVYYDKDGTVYKVSSDFYAPEVKPRPGRPCMTEYEDKGDMLFEITAISPGYNKTAGDDFEITYRKRYEEAFGTYSGQVKTVTVLNFELVRKFNVKLITEQVTSYITVNDAPLFPGSNFSGGDVIKVHADFRNDEKKRSEYMVVLAVYEDGEIVHVLPKRKIVNEEDGVSQEVYSYTLPGDEQNAYTCNLFVVNTENLFLATGK